MILNFLPNLIKAEKREVVEVGQNQQIGLNKAKDIEVKSTVMIKNEEKIKTVIKVELQQERNLDQEEKGQDQSLNKEVEDKKAVMKIIDIKIAIKKNKKALWDHLETLTSIINQDKEIVEIHNKDTIKINKDLIG